MKIINFILPLVTVFILNTGLFAQMAGDIAFTGYNADGASTDGFSFFVINEIPANTSIFFTDGDWDGTTFPTNEGTVEWSHTVAVGAGTTIVIDNYVAGAAETTLGTATEIDDGMDLSGSNDAIYAYVVSMADDTTFLSAFSNNTTVSSDYDLTGTDLIDGVTAISIGDSLDVLAMTQDLSSFCPGTGTACTDSIYNTANWESDDGPGDQNADGGIDFPASVVDPDSGIPLPVELFSFQTYLEKDVVVLEWSTVAEVNNDYFIIEKSIDNGDNFEAIAKVNGAGTTSSFTEYSYEDDFLYKNSVVYYRLKQVDFDGNFEYSFILSVGGNTNYNSTEVFPNPFDNLLNIKTHEKGDVNITIYDCTGTIVYNEKHSTTEAGEIEVLLSTDLNSGIYQMILSVSNGITLTRIVKR